MFSLTIIETPGARLAYRRWLHARQQCSEPPLGGLTTAKELWSDADGLDLTSVLSDEILCLCVIFTVYGKLGLLATAYRKLDRKVGVALIAQNRARLAQPLSKFLQYHHTILYIYVHPSYMHYS